MVDSLFRVEIRTDTFTVPETRGADSGSPARAYHSLRPARAVARSNPVLCRPSFMATATILAWLIPPLACLAGHLAWTRLPAGGNEQDDGFERVYACLLCGVLLTGAFAILLTAAGFLKAWTLAILLGATVTVLFSFPRRPRSGPRLTRSALLSAAAAIAILVATLAPASEDVLGGRDQGVYTNTAGWMAARGTIRIDSPPLASVAALRDGPFSTSGPHLAGFHVVDPERGEIRPQFLHLLPAYMAVGHWLGGIRGALLVPPLIGVFSGLAVFCFVRRMLGDGPALVAVTLLALNLAQMWGLRSPYSEGFAQLTVFAALWAIDRAHETGGLRWGVLAGAALGAAFLNRIDAALVPMALAPAIVALQAHQNQPPRWVTHALLPAALLLAACGTVYALLLSPIYVALNLNRTVQLVAAAGVVLAGCAAAMALRTPARALLDSVDRWSRTAWFVAGGLLSAAFVFALWIRPSFEVFYRVTRSGRRLYGEQSLARVGWYFSEAGLILALAGCLLLLHRWLRRRQPRWAPFLFLLLAFSLLFFYKPVVAPDHPWMMRRYLPVIVPGFVIAITALAAWGWSLAGRWRRTGRALAVAVVAIVGVHEIRMSAPFWRFREHQGAIAQLRAVAALVPEDALLLSRGVGVESRIATPLALLWGRPVLPVIGGDDGRPGDARGRTFNTQVREWLARGQDVLLLAGDHEPAPYVADGIEWREVSRIDFRIETMSSGVWAPPRQPRTFVEPYHLLRAFPPGKLEPCAPRTVAPAAPLIGGTRGLYASEWNGEERFRWTSPAARIRIPECDRSGAARPAVLRVRGGCWRDPARADCRVAVGVNGHAAGTIVLARELRNHDVAVPAGSVADASGPVEIDFSGPSFVPEQHYGGDRRQLSFQLGEVTILGPGSGRAPASGRAR
jgi:hypothetical protein